MRAAGCGTSGATGIVDILYYLAPDRAFALDGKTDYPCAAMKPHFSIDRCERSGEILLLQGWILDEEPCTLALQGKTAGGSAWNLDIPVELDRSDVRARYPEAGDRPCGFFYYGRLPRGQLMALVMRRANGDAVVLADFARIPEETNLQKRARSLHLLARQAFALARDRKWRLLFGKISRRLAASCAPKAQLDQAMRARMRELDINALVIDHDLGGGANLYRDCWIEERCVRGDRVGLIVYSILRLGYVLTVYDRRGSFPVGVFSSRDLGELLSSIDADTFFYNDAVSHPDALLWPTILCDIKSRHPARRIIFALHDFFALCPSPHLLDVEERFCGIPQDMARCEDCLARSRQPFVDLYRDAGIALWRTVWGRFLGVVNEILIFSTSGGELLLRAYPEIDRARIALRPHSLAPLASDVARRINDWRSARAASGVIAIVGSITSTAKGARVVQQLAEWLHTRGLPWKLRMIGTCSPRVSAPPSVYEETGPYSHEELIRHVIECDPDLFLFPSIAPETFSFVIHELERFGLPIAAFPVGAQGDFLTRYTHSIVLPSEAADDPEALAGALAPYLPERIDLT